MVGLVVLEEGKPELNERVSIAGAAAGIDAEAVVGRGGWGDDRGGVAVRMGAVCDRAGGGRLLRGAEREGPSCSAARAESDRNFLYSYLASNRLPMSMCLRMS